MVQFAKTWVWSLALATGLVLGFAQVAGAHSARQAADPAAVVIAFEKLVGDPQGTDAALALWAENGVQKIVPAPQGTSGVWTGQAELRQAFEYAVTHKVKRELVGTPQVAGNTVTYMAMATNDVFLHLGVAPVQFNTEAVVDGGKITSYTTSIVPSEGARVAAAAAAQQPAQQAADPAAVVIAFEKLVGDPQGTAAALALWAANGVQKIVPAPQGTSGVWTGQAELRQAFDYAVTHKVKRELVGTPQVAGNKVTYMAMATNDVFLHLGVAPVQFNTEAVIEGGKITSYTTSIVPSEGARVAAAAAAQQPAQPPAGMPSTGDSALATSLAGLLVAGLLCLVVGVFARRMHWRV